MRRGVMWLAVKAGDTGKDAALLGTEALHFATDIA
jgi:hypothetical protein